HRIVESTSEHIKIEFNFEKNYQVKKSIVEGKKFNYIEGKGLSVRLPGEPWIPNYNLNVGIPHNAIVNLKVLESKQENIPDVFIIPIADSLNQPFELLSYNKEIYNSNTYFPGLPAEISGDFVMRYARLISLSIAPYQFNPISRDLIFNKKLTLIIEFKPDPQNYEVINNVNDKMTDDILKSSVINYNIAKEFIGKPISDSPKITEPYWYNPQKDYFNIYLNKKGVYRVTCDMLVNAGVPAGGLQNMQLELFNNGESIPIDVVDVNNDNFFNSGDYFQFVGGPAKPVNEYTRKNIYNLNNVYWFSYQADSLNYYKYKDGNPTFSTPFITNSIETLNWEQDNSFQRFGHALNGNRDYWFWGGAEA
ncbi:MAG: C25 family peptidase propeptide domain-containing protein, partial [Ignavibacteria bacterium]|nr:C25 family peptidase propeptide domain-containing protein [Ignavibacteria bacterium]